MPNVISLITKYMKNAIDTVFMEDSKTKILENGSKFIDVNFSEAGYVKVLSLLMDGLSDYYRVNNANTSNTYSHYINGSADGYKVGNVESTWELFKLEYDRGKQFQIDSMDDEESAGLIIGNLLTEFLRTKVVPEVDAVRFSKLVSKASVSLGNYTTEAISANTIINKFNSAYEWLSEHEVPEEDQVIFVSPAVMTLIRNTTELYKKLSQMEYKSGDVTFTIEGYEGRPIIVVPSNRFFTNVIVGDNGYYAGSDSKLINFIICSKKAIIPIVKLNKSKVWTPSQVQDFDGYKVNFRIYHDVIIPKNKIAGVYVSVSNTNGNTKANKLSLDITVDGGKYTVKEYFTNPAGLMGTIYRSASAFTLGSTVTESATVVKTEVGVAYEKFGTETAQYYALVDGNKNVIAISGSVTLPA